MFYTESAHIQHYSVREAFTFLSLAYTGRSSRHVKGNNDLSSESRCLRTSVGAGWVYLLRSQIDDTIFSNFICSPDSLSESERDDTRRERAARPFPALFFYSVFHSNIPREILHVIAMQSCVSGFRLTIASNYSQICVAHARGRSCWKGTDGFENYSRVWMKKYPQIDWNTKLLRN